MSAKQDRVAARTVEDLERKYNYERRFAKVLGLIDEERKNVDAVESSLRSDITNTATSLRRDTEQIVANATKEIQRNVDGSISSLTEQVTAQITADAAKITAIEERIDAGAEKVVTKTGYTFDANGLNISKTGEEMQNTLDNTGMYVKRSGENILTANSMGVEALNVHVKTHLIVGDGDGRIRFEDYGADRTGCFWVGG